MDRHEVRIRYNSYSQLASLPTKDQQLIAEAIRACHMAYAPYSSFRVGAAIRSIDQDIVIGSNQENSAFPIGQCAERVALYQFTHSLGRKPIDTIAIVVDHEQQQTPASPCGSCRQILAEYRTYQSTPIRLLLTLVQGGEVIEIEDAPDLLPLAFDGKFLGK